MMWSKWGGLIEFHGFASSARQAAPKDAHKYETQSGVVALQGLLWRREQDLRVFA